MAIKLSISEVLNKCKEFKSVKEKAEWLQQNDAVPVRTVLRLIYDEDIEFLVPDTPPPWKKNNFPSRIIVVWLLLCEPYN